MDVAGREAKKSLAQLDRLADWPDFEHTAILPLRCDSLRLLAQAAHHAGDSAEAFRITGEMLAAYLALPAGLLVRPENEAMPRLALAASDLSTYAIAAGPSCLPEARLKINQATALCRSAHEQEPKSAPLARSLAQCLHATARLSLHSGPGTDLHLLFQEAASLLSELPSGARRSSLPLAFEISGTVIEWARTLQDHPDATAPASALILAQKFIAHLRQNGDSRDDVLIQRAQILLYQSRLACRNERRKEGARPISSSLSLLCPRQLRAPDRTSLALVTAAALYQARSLAEFPETKWTAEHNLHLEKLLGQLTAKSAELTPQQQRELATLQ